MGDQLSLTGLGGETFVLQMTYDPALLPPGITEADLALGWFNGSDWVNATLGNTSTDPGAVAGFEGTWVDAGAPLTLGSFGVDPANDRVWAVVDHNSRFGVTSTVPEPTSLVLVGIAALLGASGTRQRRT